MKIFLISHGIYPQRGGVELHVYRIAEGLRALGHEPCAIVQSGAPSDSLSNGFRVVRGASLATVKRLLASERPDVLHAHGARSVFGARCLLAARKAGIRTAFTPHCFYPAQDFAGKIKRLAFDKTLGRAAMKASDCIIALTENDRQDAVMLGAEAARMTIIPNSITLPHALPETYVRAWREKHCLGKFLLSVGRLDRVKRGDFPIRALAELPRDMNLVFIGPDAGCRDEWQKLAAEMGLSHNVHFLGEVSDNDLIAAYQACSALVLASKYEGLPTVILEAMALGAAVVASATGGTRCLIKDRENGFLFTYNHPTEFIAAVKAALDPSSSLIAERASKMVVAEYSWEANIPRICRLYEMRAEVGEGAAYVVAQ
ncbi:MAG TPA: glycosyltransferase family 4 protein [Candidatus Angelobacter sp.]|nr:glycosyltransferase family 4 protein [Candidatus Angelobacter sp.]